MRIALSVSDKEKAKGANSPYLKALLAVGVAPDEVDLLTGKDLGRVKVKDYDGVLFSGGPDVNPECYEEPVKYRDLVSLDNPRDAFEFDLLDQALKERIPILGICRGIQMINVKMGGTLYQDLNRDLPVERDHHQSGPRSDATHSVVVTEPQSVLAGAFTGNCRVNSLHHQAIRGLGRGLKRTAYSEDGLCEAIESADDYPFLLAVQWHPEEMVDHPEQRRIFEQFVAKCREAAARRG